MPITPKKPATPKRRPAPRQDTADAAERDQAEPVPPSLAAAAAELKRRRSPVGRRCVLHELDPLTGRIADRYGEVADVRYEESSDFPAGRDLAVVAWVAGGVADGVPLEELDLIG
jgi:hypothetical protein